MTFPPYFPPPARRRSGEPGPIRIKPLVCDHAKSEALWFVLVFLLGLLAGLVVAIALALNAATSTPLRWDDTGQNDVAAVRADMARTTHQQPPPASDVFTLLDVTTPRESRDDPAAATPSTGAAILGIIRNAAVEFGQDPDEMVRVAFCESSLRPDAIGDGGAAVGLWQFHEPTFRANARRLFRRDVGDRRSDPVTSSLVAAWMFSIGQRGQWTCAR